MFGFLKDKLKKAIGAFSKGAESEVKEEKVEEQQAIDRAKEEEKKILAKAKPAPKKVEKKVEEKKPVIPEKKVEEKKKEIPPAQKPTRKPEVKKEPVLEKKIIPETKPTSEKKIIPAPEKKPVPIPEKIPEEKTPEKKPETKTEKAKPVETPVHEEKKGFFSKLFGKKEEKVEEKKKEEKVPEKTPAKEERKEETKKEAIKEIPQKETQKEEPTHNITEEEKEEEIIEEEPEEERSGFFGKLKEAFTKKTLTSEKFDELFWELEIAMLENNVAVEVIEKIKDDLRDELTSGKVSRMGIEDMITVRLRQSIEELFDVETFDLIARIKSAPKPFKLCIIGVNGSGKTTTLAKIVHLLQKNNLTCVVAASDTFRAAAIDQLKEHTDRLNVKLISQGYGADPAAVAFDAIKHAEAKGIDVVLIDTAGRLHSNTNLMQELEKVVRVSKPDLKLFVGEAITGNDCVEQAQVFNRLVGIDAIVLSKADIDEKGGAAISVSYVTGKPILYLGMGQGYDDLVPFDKEKIIESLELE
jgi:fused signal recognition particle receptor